MPTLDEVIKAMENCYGSDAECCDKCSYTMEVTGHGVICRKCDLEDDALHYLKEFQGLSKMWNDKLDKEQENPPLTWDELKQMRGKPVWVEHHLFKGWRLIGWQGNDHMMNLVGPYSEQLPLFADGCGCDWQVYRKERK